MNRNITRYGDLWAVQTRIGKVIVATEPEAQKLLSQIEGSYPDLVNNRPAEETII
jgi:hypothetical protein